MLAFKIGGDESEYVRVQILSDNGDGWFAAEVELAVGSFRACYPADFNSWAFPNFRAQLAAIHQTVSGSAEFTSYEEQLELTLVCDSHGHIELRGEARDVAGTGNRLTFQLHIDQTYLPKILTDLDSALVQFPPRAG